MKNIFRKAVQKVRNTVVEVTSIDFCWCGFDSRWRIIDRCNA